MFPLRNEIALARTRTQDHTQTFNASSAVSRTPNHQSTGHPRLYNNLSRHARTTDLHQETPPFRQPTIPNKKWARKFGSWPGQRLGQGSPRQPRTRAAAVATIAEGRRRRGRGRRAQLWQRREAPEKQQPWKGKERGEKAKMAASPSPFLRCARARARGVS
jgi:hypothetical protein